MRPDISISLADVSIRIESKKVLYNWIEKVIRSEQKVPLSVAVVLCSDEFLLDMNKKFLDHDYYTDIITFDYCEGNLVSGELYISIDRVKENAGDYKVTFKQELHRVIIHGVLHLCGYKDKSKKEAETMRKKENEKLKLLAL